MLIYVVSIYIHIEVRPTAVHATLLHLIVSSIGKHVPSLDKVVYLENRRFLPEGHELRRTKGFPGVEHETRERPNSLTNEDILWSAVAHSRAKNKTQESNVLKVKCFFMRSCTKI